MKGLYFLPVLLTVWPVGQAERSSFETQSDPERLIGQTIVQLPKPTIFITIEDMVAHELIVRSRTLSTSQALEVAHVIYELSTRLEMDPLLFIALIRVESNFNHLAASKVGAEGLMQVMPYTAEQVANKIGLEWPDGHSFDPVLNVTLGIHYLASMNEEFDGQIAHALTAYNRGPENTWYILDHNEGELPPEVHKFYSAKVLRHYKNLQKRYENLSGF